MKTLSAGLLGLSHLHPRSYMPLFEAVDGLQVVAAADANPTVLDGFAKDFSVRGYADWREMIEKERLDLAAIFLPHAECPAAAVACAERGIHLVVEKPMASTAEGVERMKAAAEKAGVLLTTPYVWRYHPVAIQMRDFVRQGVLGQIVGCEGRCAAGRLNRYIEGNAAWMLQKALSGGGPMFNLGVHWIDLYRWFLDDEVVEVVGKNVKVNQEYDIEDNSFAILTFSRGTVVTLDISYTVPDSYPYGRDLHLSLRGTRGVLSWSPSFEGVRERLFVCSDADSYASSPRRHIDFELTAAPGYTGILGHHFLAAAVQAIRDGQRPAITAADGVRALQVVEAVYQSAQSGRAIRL
ncbi:MAG: Gfo/Idh/MocA family oxidoreductase [Armatimonadetes bacterium]|nr:Gfo/Idh/MocA family oxidoreductase [Armatimonadota bacterium]